jgi:hypothetical protein
MVTKLKHGNCNSLADLQTPYITHKVFSSQPHSCNWLLTTLHCAAPCTYLSRSRSHIATDGQSVSLGVEPHLGLMTGYLLLFDSYSLVFVGRSLWREDGSVSYVCCWPLPAQSFSRPYFTVSDLRLPFSSPPTTRRVTVEVFDPASTRITYLSYNWSSLYRLRTDNIENTSHVIPSHRVHWRTDCCLTTSCNLSPLSYIFHWCTLELFLPSRYLETLWANPLQYIDLKNAWKTLSVVVMISWYMFLFPLCDIRTSLLTNSP